MAIKIGASPRRQQRIYLLTFLSIQVEDSSLSLRVISVPVAAPLSGSKFIAAFEASDLRRSVSQRQAARDFSSLTETTCNRWRDEPISFTTSSNVQTFGELGFVGSASVKRNVRKEMAGHTFMLMCSKHAGPVD